MKKVAFQHKSNGVPTVNACEKMQVNSLDQGDAVSIPTAREHLALPATYLTTWGSALSCACPIYPSMTTHHWVAQQPMSIRRHALHAPTPSTNPCLAPPIVRDAIVWAFRVDTRLRISLSEQSGHSGFEGRGFWPSRSQHTLAKVFPGSPRS